MAIVQIRIPKGEGSVPMDTEALPQEVYQAALMIGLEKLALSGITSTKYPTKGLEGEALTKTQAAVMTKAAENVAELVKVDDEGNYTGAVKLPGTKATKVKGLPKGEVSTEAMRLARNIIKDEIKRLGEKPSHYASAEITRAAKAQIESDPSIVVMAEENVKRRKAKDIKINVAELIKPDAKLVKVAAEKAAKAKAERKTTLSATQAGKVAPRQKPKAEARAH